MIHCRCNGQTITSVQFLGSSLIGLPTNFRPFSDGFPTHFRRVWYWNPDFFRGIMPARNQSAPSTPSHTTSWLLFNLSYQSHNLKVSAPLKANKLSHIFSSATCQKLCKTEILKKVWRKGGYQNPFFPAYSEGTFSERKQILRIFTPKPPAKTRFFQHIVRGYFGPAKKIWDFYPKGPCKTVIIPAYSGGQNFSSPKGVIKTRFSKHIVRDYQNPREPWQLNSVCMGRPNPIHSTFTKG